MHFLQVKTYKLAVAILFAVNAVFGVNIWATNAKAADSARYEFNYSRTFYGTASLR